MSESHGERNFAGVWRGEGSSLLLRNEKNKAREIFGIVLNSFGENDAAVVFGSAASSDACERLVSARESVANAASGVFGGNAF